MLKWIRPAGAIGFLAVILVIGLFWFLLADWLLKTGIEAAGTRMVGAKVELTAAQLTFSPLGFRLHNLQVTNPRQPMQNLVELDAATGNLELVPLLMGKVIVDEFSANGVRFSTQRTTSGAIEKPKGKVPQDSQQGKQQNKQQKQEQGGFASKVQDKLPSVDEIMAKEPLTTVEQTKTFQKDVKNQRGQLQQTTAALPDTNKIKQFDQRLKDTTGGDIKSVDDFKRREKELEKLKDEIRADRDTLIKARDQVRNAKNDLNTRYNALKQAPAADWNRIKNRYGLSATGAGNITRLLFGNTAGNWLETLLSWAGQIQHLLPTDTGTENQNKPVEPPKPPRGQGRFIRFPTDDPLPDFLVRKALLTLDLAAGQIELSVTDATTQPQVLGRPMRLHGAGENLQNAQRIVIDGTLNHVNPAAPKDQLQWTLTDWKLKDVNIAKDSSLPLTMASAQANLSGKVELAGQSLTANIDSAFANSQWHSSAQEGWQGRVVKTLTDIHKFNLQGNIQGNIASPRVSLRSDLDEQLKQAVAGQLKAAQAELEQKLKTRLDAEVAQAAGPYKDQLAFLTDTEGSVNQRISQLDEMLKAKLKSAVDSKKKEAKDKLKDQLKGLKF